MEGIPSFPTSGWGWGDPSAPEGGPRYGLGECPPAFPTGVLFWATPPPPNSGHSSRGDVSRAGNWAGPRKSPSGRQIPTGLEASGEGDSLPDSSAPSPLCPPSVLPEEKQGPGLGQKSHGKMTAKWKIEPGLQTLCLLACFAGELFPSSPYPGPLPPGLQHPH